MTSVSEYVPEPTDDELKRLNALLHRIGGQHVTWGAASLLEVLLVEHRIQAERRSSARLTWATYVLAVSTVVLAIATVVLVFVTAGAD